MKTISRPVDPPHLGGYKSPDPLTYVPALFRFLLKTLRPRSMLDIGCGTGHTVKFFRNHGVDAWGLDGSKQAVEDAVTGWVNCFDFTLGRSDESNVDLIWSAEFVEHVEEKYSPNFLTQFARAQTLVMTHATPGQTGHHHVNEQDSRYWIDLLTISYGMDFNPFLTQFIRKYFSPPGAGYGIPNTLVFHNFKPFKPA